MAPPLPLTTHVHRLRRIRSFFCALAFAALAVQAGCGDPEEKRNEALREEIIEVHDRAMDKIGLMYMLETKLKNEPPAGASEELIDRRVEALQEANRAMFGWMNRYQPLGVAGDTAADNRYRLEQLEKIKEVSRLIDQAIAEARQLRSDD